MKSKLLRYRPRNGLLYGLSDGQVGAAARWGMSTALALGWLAALGVFATPGGSGGPAAPASRLGLVRLATQQVAPPSAEEESGAEQNTRQPSPTEKSTDVHKATEIPAQEAEKFPAQEAQPPVASRKAHDATEGEPSPELLPEPSPEPQHRPESEADSKPLSTQADKLGQENGEISNQAAEPAATVINTAQNSDNTPPSHLANIVPNNTGQASREMNVAQLDAGFGLLQPVWPAYPALAKRLGKAGRVRLELRIDPDGRVYRVNVVDEISGWGFGHSTESAYRNARFTRPTVGGRPVRVLWRKTVIFRP